MDQKSLIIQNNIDYYEILDGNFVKTEDIILENNKDYYIFKHIDSGLETFEDGVDYYEILNGSFTKTDDEEPDSGKDYYILKPVVYLTVLENDAHLGSIGYFIKTKIVKDHKDKYDSCYNQLCSTLTSIKMRKD